MKVTSQLTIDGATAEFTAGETILTVARRARTEPIPTLCHDDRLAPMGACRMCLVEVEGRRRLEPSCRVPAEAGMVVHTANERVDRHRKALLALYLSDHTPGAGDCETAAPCAVHRMADQYGADDAWPRMESQRPSYDQPNPYIAFRADRCILCAQCVRYCDEVEAVAAITLAGRGAHTTIATADGISLLDSTCELCGGCVSVCPTGAMTEAAPLRLAEPAERELTKVRTTCNYCGVGCQLDLNVDPAGHGGRGRVVKVTSPPAGTIPNDGNTCVKGRFAYEFIHHDDRLTTPLVRGDDGELHPATWERALEVTAAGLRGVADRHGADGLAFVSSSRCTVEENYLVQKLSRAVFGTHNVHQCAAT